MMRIRLAVLAVFVASAVAFASIRAKAADAPSQGSKAPAANESKDEGASDKPIEKIIVPRAPSRHDQCGLTGARAQNPFVTGPNLLQQSWDRDAKVGRALLSSGDYVWVDLKACTQYRVVARLFVERGPKSDDTRYWLGRAAEVADLLSGPFLDDEALALEKIARSGKWFTHKTSNGATMEFPMAMERVHFAATVVDYDGFSVLTLEQDAS